MKLQHKETLSLNLSVVLLYSAIGLTKKKGMRIFNSAVSCVFYGFCSGLLKCANLATPQREKDLVKHHVVALLRFFSRNNFKKHKIQCANKIVLKWVLEGTFL